MGSGDKDGCEKSSKEQVWKRNVKSDDSDEDYMVEEDEADDLSDELESLVGDASYEERLGSFVDEEDEIVGKAENSNLRKRSIVRTENGTQSSKKRKKVAYDEEDEEHDDDDDGDDGDDDDDEFTPDDLDFSDEEELPSKARCSPKRNGNVKSRKRKSGSRVLKRSQKKKREGSSKSCKRKRTPVSRKKKTMANYDSDFANSESSDQDFTISEEELKQVTCEKSSNEQVRKRNVKSDDSDEDYMIEEDEADGLSDELESLVGDASDEESLGNFVDGEDEIVRNAEKSNLRKRSIVRTENETQSSKKRKKVVYDEEDEENEEEYHDDDDEFAPDDLEFSDEEELPSKARCSPKRKGNVKSRKRKTGSRVPKRSQKKKRKGSSKSGKRKRMPISRKENTMANDDSDFASYESSDHEFTISEEEREQVREATDFCTRLTSNLRSSKKDEEDAARYQLRRLSRKKGKEKVEEIKTDVVKHVCGICLTEEGKNTVRGTLNCCSHFYCFACIMEWSKIESRCPLCKQRFSTISKPARSATTSIDLRDVVIHVPERDQVYQPSEEEIREYLSLYENLMCTECHEGGDDSLMLLCDICDSPAHTYCVGLEREVPEGNWYCEACRPSAVGFASSQPAQTANNTAVNGPSTFENMAEIDLNISIPEIPMTPVNPRPPSVGGFQAPFPVSGMSVSTLSGRRRVHHHHLQFLLSSNRVNHMPANMDRSNLDT